MQNSDKAFEGAIPSLYDELLVPLLFEPYAADLAARLASRAQARFPRRILELAAGTGAVTRHLAASLPASVGIVATDLNPGMLDRALQVGTVRPVEWRQADAMTLPFDDGAFDAVACQFGVMFFPDKVEAFRQARRVLAPGGILLFNVWDRIEENDFAATVAAAVAAAFPEAPPDFMARTPHGYHDMGAIERDLRLAGFGLPVVIETVTARSRSASAADVARAFCQGTPLRHAIEAHGAAALKAATGAAEAALIRRFGSGPLDGKVQAHVVAVDR